MLPYWNINLLSNFRTKLFSLSTPRNEYCSKNSLWRGTTQRKIEIFFDAKTSSCLSCLHVMSLSKCMRKLPIQQWLVFKRLIYIKSRVYRSKFNNKYASENISGIDFREILVPSNEAFLDLKIDWDQQNQLMIFLFVG